MQKESSEEFRGSLKRLVEDVISEQCQLKDRGLFLCIDELVVKGHPSGMIRLWGTLHFLPLGSPFCCPEPACHLGLFGERLQRTCETVRQHLRLKQEVKIEMASMGIRVHEDVEFDYLSTGRCPSLDWYDVDRRDMLGRTALIRAAMRGHGTLVEDLLLAGANPDLVDANGRNARQIIGKKWQWLEC